MHIGFWWEDMKERNHLEDIGVDGRILLKPIFKKWYGGYGLDWTDLPKDMDMWRAIINGMGGVVMDWTGLICPKIWICGGLL